MVIPPPLSEHESIPRNNAMPATTTTQDHDVVRAKTLRGLLLARELDGARRARGFTTRALAAAISMSPAMVNRVMTGRRVPTALEVGGLCALLDVPAGRRPTLYEWARTAELTEWIIRPGGGKNPLRDIEGLADEITWFEPGLIPGPLRTAEYDRAVEHATGANPHSDPAVRAAALRNSRFLIHPRALGNPGLPERDHRAQLLHLFRDHLPGIRLFPDTVVTWPGCRVLDVAHFPPVVHLTHHDTDIVLENQGRAAHLRQLEGMALSAGETREALLRQIQACR
ncbi:hypothetical protein UO65_5292 [Actinokineospora spheciospongiae]|uniref:HTH cro/C1-type domain-containing protein n=1 Tax=Actinokineospora spheciospongiae TaxID=909613 RepID=W7ISM8_9PSEU|nr:hypothetical protein UO65_5292 [Actinokineospora spheciospongiae]